MNKRQSVQTGTPWETKVAYSRAIRSGNHVEISGTVAVDGDVLVGSGSAYEQASFILNKIEKSLIAVGGKRHHIIRTRMYVSDIANWEVVGKAHGEFFSGINPATTLVAVANLIHPEYLVEIDATAIIDD